MKNHPYVAVLLLAFGFAASPAPAQNVAYYVSTTGNDSNPGTLLKPLATVAGVESKLAATYLSHCAAQTAPILVQFRGGTWYNQQISLTQSGCSSKAPVVFENYPGEVPVFSAGTRITNWIYKGGSLWEATLPASTVNFEALFYNGQRRMRPRLGSAIAGTLGQYYYIAGPVAGHDDRFYYKPGDPISTLWSNYSPSAGNLCGQKPGPSALQGEIQVVDFELWDVSRQRISCIDSRNHIIYLTGSTTSGYAHGYIANHRYLIENVKNDLTVAGQWYLDRAVAGAWVLQYLANPGEDPNADTVVVPQQSQILTAKNLQYRDFFGLTFADDNYVIPATGYAGSQAEVLVPPAVECMDCSNLTFDSDIVTNTTGYGLGLLTDDQGTSANNLIQNNAFYDIGGGGITLGKVASATDTDSNVPQFGTVQNNIVEGYGRVFAGAAGVALLIGHDMTFTHNDVTDGYSHGIMVCFPDATLRCAGLSNSNGSFNVTTSYNRAWNLGQGILNDFGGVYYATYNATGEVIIGNKVHDFSDASAIGDADGYGANGIYLDRGGPIGVSNNLVYRTGKAINITEGPAKLGQTIAISNNILAYNRESVISVYQCPKPGYSQFSFDTNIVYQDRTGNSVPSWALQAGLSYLGNPVGTVQSFASNDYWNTSENFAATDEFTAQNSSCVKGVDYTLAGWQALGEDRGSLSQNPAFMDPSYPADDYAFIGGPPPIGFVPFNTSGICSTCAGRDNPVLNPPAVPESFPTSPFPPSAF